MKAKAGRPTDFTPELGAEICARLIQIGSLRKVCEADDMPCKATVFNWLIKADENNPDDKFAIFLDQYTRARQISKDYKFDEHWEELEEIAYVPIVIDDVPLTGPDGQLIKQVTSQSVAFAKLKHDAFKWQASKENPKKYGDKTEVEHTGTINTLSDDQIEAKLAAILAKTGQ